MITRITRFLSTDQPQLADMGLAIRTEVFVRGQHVDPSLEYEHEEEAHHYLLFLEDKPVATARWRETAKGIKLERFATLPDYRNKGFGSELLKEILKDVASSGNCIYLHSQLLAVPFYEKFNFLKEGDLFREADIDHFLMIYRQR